MDEMIYSPASRGFIDAVLHGPFMEEKNFRFLLPPDTPTKTLEILFRGWEQVTLDTTCSALNEILHLCKLNIIKIKKEYEYDFLFFPPELFVTPNPLLFTLRISMQRKDFKKEK